MKIHRRRRGTIIYETDKGILVAAGHKKIYLLPGGGAKKYESRRMAGIRELAEETGIIAHNAKFLFRHKGKVNHYHHFQDHHSVFLVTSASGNARPHHEIAYIAFYQKGSGIHVSRTTREIIDRYLKHYKTDNSSSRIKTFFNRALEFLGL